MNKVFLLILAIMFAGFIGCGVSAEPVEVTVIWTAPGDDGYKGQASDYDLRHATDSASLIIDWTACTEIETGFPSVAGTTDTAHAFLRPGIYYMAIKAVDDGLPQEDGIPRPNWSLISNIVRVFIADDQPPGIIVDLRRAQ